ncbi:uncharacterized protein LOC115708805 isoform X1 [Cannabis sativa]|uniref:uncharacterized protein LOC115708805 isoform X1 n=1 Tax=Cannabis sativa TaxID=3483 RepID=UPI0029CA7759|nr:uncharacterized protein LOC115708805 isoform X1 [Cannabis sativa]XP_030492681.2 uncharacterized protein LOC115708805 isoform X1 [Cannabis sativa]XP_060967647.1 uncharacterized protein LOC115708805 isoform X1 [Cannabis sativa]
MEGNSVNHENDNEEEYVLLDLDSVSGQLDIPPDAPYVLSGLDTMNPMLTIGGLKLIGEYEETVGTCLIFTEKDAEPLVHEETGPSEENLFSGKCIIDPSEPQTKQVKERRKLNRSEPELGWDCTCQSSATWCVRSRDIWGLYFVVAVRPVTCVFWNINF